MTGGGFLSLPPPVSEQPCGSGSGFRASPYGYEELHCERR